MTPKQELALAYLIESGSRKEAAKKAGITERTLYKYLKDEEFSAAYRAARSEMMKNTTDRINACMMPAINTLLYVMKSGSPNARVAAARTILEYGLRITEANEIMERIIKLEDIANGGKQ